MFLKTESHPFDPKPTKVFLIGIQLWNAQLYIGALVVRPELYVPSYTMIGELIPSSAGSRAHAMDDSWNGLVAEVLPHPQKT